MEYKKRNECSGAELVAKHGELNLVKNPKKDNKLFFTCGSIIGGIGPKLREKLEKDINSVELSDIRFAEVSRDGGTTYVPVIMLKSANNVVKTFK